MGVSCVDASVVRDFQGDTVVLDDGGVLRVDKVFIDIDGYYIEGDAFGGRHIDDLVRAINRFLDAFDGYAVEVEEGSNLAEEFDVFARAVVDGVYRILRREIGEDAAVFADPDYIVVHFPGRGVVAGIKWYFDGDVELAMKLDVALCGEELG